MTLQIKRISTYITAIATFPIGAEYFDHTRDMSAGCLEPNGIYVEFSIIHYRELGDRIELTFSCKRRDFETLQNAIAA